MAITEDNWPVALQTLDYFYKKFFKNIFAASSASSEKAMAPHSNTLAWKILWTEEPGVLQSMGLLRVGLD